MDIVGWLAFGERHLANQYYIVVSPYAVVFGLAGLILLPMLAAWRYGKAGLAWMVVFLIMGIAASYVWACQQTYIDQEFAAAMATLHFRLAAILVAVVSVSAAAAWLWIVGKEPDTSG